MEILDSTSKKNDDAAGVIKAEEPKVEENKADIKEEAAAEKDSK